MIKLRLAVKDDLPNMIDLWAEIRHWEFKNPRYEDDWLAAPVSYVLELSERWKRDIDDQMVLAAYDGRNLIGFCVSSMYKIGEEPPECLFINEVYISEWAQDPELASRMIVQLGKKADHEGCQRMCIGISSDRKDDLKEQCVRLGAKYAWAQGMNYCCYENYEWRDLSVFSKMDK